MSTVSFVIAFWSVMRAKTIVFLVKRRPRDGVARRLASKSAGKAGLLAGGQEMICPKCKGNGYWIEQLRVLRQVRQCIRCRSQGEIKESKDEKTNED